MLRFIHSFFKSTRAQKTEEAVAPYKIETPAAPVVEAAPVVNTPAPVINGRRKPAAKKTADVVTGNKPVKKAADKKPVEKKTAPKPRTKK